MATECYIETLLRLDESSSHFPEQLPGVLARSDSNESIQGLRTSDLAPIIENTNNVSDNLSPAGATFAQTHGTLQRICILLPSPRESSRHASNIRKHCKLRFVNCYSNPHANHVTLLVDIPNGLECLHSPGVLYGDLKGPNILVDVSDHARTTDFDFIQRSFGEILKAEGQGSRWTVIVMIEVLTGGIPFDNDPSVEMAAIMSGERSPLSTHEAFTDRLWRLVQRWSAKDPHERPRMSVALKGLNPSPSPTPSDMSPRVRGSMYNTGSCSSLLLASGPDAVDPYGFAPPSNPPPLKFAEVDDGSQKERVIDRSVSSVPQPLLHLDFDTSACKRLTTHTSSKTDVIPLIKEIFANQDEVKMIGHLPGDNAQAFIDVMDEILDRTELPPRLWRKCLSALCKMCGRYGLLPRSLKIPLCYDRLGTPLYRGGYADVWKGEHQGRQVAVKVLRVYSTSNFEKITSRFCKEVVPWKVLRHPNVVPLLGVTMDNSISLFTMTSEWMENGNINEFVKAHQDANRFELLKDVAEGLIYMHSQAMIHGDLKGANILIDRDCHACLADFGLLTIASDPTNPTTMSSSATGGTTRWMSPELLDPDQFGIKDGRPTRESDSYALGMVILEVLSGHSPFKQYRDVVVMRMVLEGKLPERPRPPEGAWFTDDLWQMLTLCWKSQRQSRPSIEAILEYLEKGSSAWEPPSMQVGEDAEVGEDDWDLTTTSNSSGMVVEEALPTMPGSYPVEGSDEIAVHDESVLRFGSRGLTDGIRGLVDALGLSGRSPNPLSRLTAPATDRGLGMTDMHPQTTSGAKQGPRGWEWVHSVARAVGLHKYI